MNNPGVGRTINSRRSKLRDPWLTPNGTHFRHVGPSLRDGYRDFIAVIASLGETRPRDIRQSECHWANASGSQNPVQICKKTPQESEICAIYRTLVFNNGTEAQEVKIQAVAHVGAWDIAYTGQIDWPVQLRRQHVRIG